MNTRFTYNEPEQAEPVRIEQVFAEKPAGGMIKAPAYDAPATTAVSANADGSFSLIKGCRVYAETTGTSVQIEKGSGIAKSDIVGYGSKAVTVSNVNNSNANYDTITLSATLGSLNKGDVLFEAAAAATEGATVKATPVYVTGNSIEGGKGDQFVRLINGANLRKETAMIGKDVAALMSGIHLV